MQLKLLSSLSDYITDVDELRTEWIKSVLSDCDVNIDDLDHPKMVELLYSNGVQIISRPSTGACEIFHKGELVGKWSGPELKLKKEEDELYYEITVEYFNLKS